jgi:hypothetical protein
MKKIITWVLLASLFLFSCAPKQFIPFEPPDVVFEKTPEYVLDLDSITKPKKIKAIYVDENFKEVPKEEAKFVVLAPKEYAKISALLKLAKAYKEIAKEQEVLINTNISVINSLKEYVALEQMKAKEYRQLWADSENAYRQENYNRKIDNAIYKGTFGAIFLGVILAIVAL